MRGIYAVYLLTNRPRGRFYCGVTNDLARRLAEHRDGQPGSFTSRYNLHRLVWYEPHTEIEAAILREKRLKRWRRPWKFDLVEATNPTWRDLSADWRGLP